MKQKPFIQLTLLLLFFVCLGMWVILPEAWALNSSLTALTLVYSVAVFYWTRSHLPQKSSAVIYYGLSTFFLFLILAFVNFLGARHPWQMDVTEGKFNSLTEKTEKVLSRFKGELEFLVFLPKQQRETVRNFLELYTLTKRDVKITYVDPTLRPELVQRYQVAQYGTLILKWQKRTVQTLRLDELGIINALLRLSRERPLKIGWVTGHQELNGFKEDLLGGRRFFQLLEEAAYEVKPLSLLTDSWEEFEALLVLGPGLDLLPAEVNVLKAFMHQKRRLFVALGPSLGKKNQQKALRSLLAEWGILFRDNLIVDRQSVQKSVDSTVLILEDFGAQHTISKNLQGEVLFPLSSSLEKNLELEKKQRFFRVDPLLSSHGFPDSWAEANWSDILQGESRFEVGQDLKGPLAVAMASQEVQFETSDKPARLVGWGTALPLNNAHILQGVNAPFILNALSWLMGEEDLVSLERPSTSAQQVAINDISLRVLLFISLLLVPLILLLFAGFFFWQRKQ